MLTLTWKAPADGGSAIIGYVVTPSIGGVTQTPIVFNSTAVSETISGLTSGKSYTFTVTATNAVEPISCFVRPINSKGVNSR